MSCAALIAVLHGCGGGGQTASNNNGGVGSGGTGSYTNGPISGLGSIFVNGVRYDVSDATVLSDDKTLPSGADLQIGVVVEVDGGVVTPGVGTASSTAKAARVRYASELIGPVTSDITSGGVRQLTVMGQSVVINAATEPLDPSIVQGSKVKVYGLPGATGVFTATLVLPLASPSAYKVSGVVSHVSASSISIGSGPQVVNYASGSLPAGLVVGSYARAQVSLTPVSGNAWTALPSGIKLRAPLVTDQRDGRLEGVVQPMGASSTMGYINGTQIDFSAVLGQLVQQCTSPATPSSPTTIADCVSKRVEVEGQYSNGVLTATKAELDDDTVASAHELVGTVSSLVPNTSFTLTRSSGTTTTTYTVLYNTGSPVSTEVHGNVTLQAGACVQVNWQVADPANPLRITAKEIEASTDCH